MQPHCRGIKSDVQDIFDNSLGLVHLTLIGQVETASYTHTLTIDAPP